MKDGRREKLARRTGRQWKMHLHNHYRASPRCCCTMGTKGVPLVYPSLAWPACGGPHDPAGSPILPTLTKLAVSTPFLPRKHALAPLRFHGKRATLSITNGSSCMPLGPHRFLPSFDKAGTVTRVCGVACCTTGVLLVLFAALCVQQVHSVALLHNHNTTEEHTATFATLTEHSNVTSTTTTTTENMQAAKQLRSVARLVTGTPVSDGAGVKLNRILGTSKLRNLDPFLMLDEFRSSSPDDYIAGFPEHPHRGFQTVTVMLKGAFEHRDSEGHVGQLRDGGVQWMNAGSGVRHSEMPIMTEGRLHGFQLWINLPASEKFSKPGYQDLQEEDIPTVSTATSTVKVVAGAYGEHQGGVHTLTATQPLFLIVRLEQAHAVFEADVPEGHNAFVYMVHGSATVEGDADDDAASAEVPERTLAVLQPTGNRVRIRGGEGLVTVDEGDACASMFLLLAGRPLGEPVVQHGPIVMNTKKQIMEAISDLQTGRFINPVHRMTESE